MTIIHRAFAVAFGVLLGLGFAPSEAEAAKYMSLGRAVKTFIPKGSKIVKITKSLTPEHRRRLIDDYGWKSDKSKYVFYVGKQNDEPVAYVFVVPEIFNTCFHKYAVGLDANGEVIETVIIELTCPRSFPVRKKSFLSQFKEKRHVHPLTTRGGGADIDAVTGATLSSEATATASRKAVSLHNLFFGGAEPVDIDDKVRIARRAGSDMIQKAIETGQTLGEGAQLPSEDDKK